MTQALCNDISFSTNGLFTISQYDLKTMEGCGFKTDASGKPKLDTIKLTYDLSIKIIKNTIEELQKSHIYAIKVINTYQYQQIGNNIEIICNSLGSDKFDDLLNILADLLYDASNYNIDNISSIEANQNATGDTAESKLQLLYNNSTSNINLSDLLKI